MLIPFKGPHQQRGLLGAILGAGKIIGPALIGGVLSNLGAKKRNEAQIASAREQMAFQKEMSDTAHQREVQDLRAAGLNPILSATGGSGATTPGGAQAQIQDELGPAVSSAMQASQISAALKNVQANTVNTAKDTQLKSGEIMLKSQQEDVAHQQEKNLKADHRRIAAEAELTELLLPGARVEGDIDRGKSGMATRNIKRWTDLIPGLGVLIRGGKSARQPRKK